MYRFAQISMYAMVGLAAIAACGESPAQLSLLPTFGVNRQCSQTDQARLLLITSRNANADVTVAVSLDDSATIDLQSMPSTTTGLSAQLVASGGEVIAVGNTAPLDWLQLLDGTAVSVYMAPERGGCEVAAMNMARLSPMIAAAGDGALVVSGGQLVGDVSDLSAEYFEAASNTFVGVELPSVFAAADTLRGSVLLGRADGTAVLLAAGIGAYSVFDPATRRFAKPRVFDNRWQFAAAQLPDGRVAIAGGCKTAAAGRCLADPALRVLAVDLGADEVATIANLAVAQIDADLVLQPSNSGRGDSLLVVGGASLAGFAASQAQRVSLVNGAVTTVDAQGRGVSLDSGAVLAAYASPAITPSSQASVVVASSALRRAVSADALRSGPSLIVQQDGDVLVTGGGANPALYRSTTGDFSLITGRGEAVPSTQGTSAVRLIDGSVLVVGGEAGRSSAWRYRPPLVGPNHAALLVSPVTSTAALTPVDPLELTVSATAFVLAPAASNIRALAVLGGARRSAATLSIDVRASTAGLLLLFDYVGPDRWLGVEMVPGSRTQLLQRQVGGDGLICSGSTMTAIDQDQTFSMTVTDQIIEVRRGQQLLLRCELSNVQRNRGQWGVGAVGSATRLNVGQLILAP